MANYWLPDFRWSDAHADNLFARGFRYGAEDASCIAATTFEVMEHVERPVEFVEELLSAARTRTLIFTTTTYSGGSPE